MKNNIMNKLTYLFVFLSPGFVFGATGAEESTIWTWALNNVIVILAVAVIALLGYHLWNITNEIIKYQQKALLAAQGISIDEDTDTNKESFFKRMYDKAWSLIPMDKEKEIDLGHDYDGIRELDNSLPPWWLYTFYFTILFGIGYLYIYHFSDIGMSQKEEYVAAMQEAEVQKREFLAAQVNSVDESNVVVLTDAGSLADGERIFKTNCAACHGQLGEGTVGPNLTDKYWIHGPAIQDIFKTIKYGVPEKGMIAWSSQLRPASMQKVASYIKTLEGTDPPNGKAAEGDLYEGE